MSEVELSQTLSEAFNTDVEEGSSFDLVPVGNYVAIITDAMVGNLKSSNGQSIRMTWQIQGGEYDGRKMWDQVIVSHTSTEAMKFGRRKLKDIADACGVKVQALLNLRQDRTGQGRRVPAEESYRPRQADRGAREDEQRQAGLQRLNSILSETGNTGAGANCRPR